MTYKYALNRAFAILIILYFKNNYWQKQLHILSYINNISNPVCNRIKSLM